MHSISRVAIPFCLFFNLVFYEISAQPLKDTLFVDRPGEYPVYKHLYFLGTSEKYTPQFVYDSVSSMRFTRLYPNKSFNNTTSQTPYYWIWVTIKNNMDNDQLFYYWLNSPGLSFVRLYEKKQDGKFEASGITGFHVPFNERQTKSHDAEFNFSIRKGETCVILMLIENPYGTNAYFLPRLSDAGTRKGILENFSLITGLIIGIMMITCLLNIFLAVSLKLNIHYLYAVYVLAQLYEILTLSGFAEGYFGTNDYRMAEMVSHVFPVISLFLMTRIMQWFLNQKRNNSYCRIIVDCVLYFLCFLALLYIITYFAPFTLAFLNLLQIILSVASGLLLLLIMLSAIEKTIQKHRLAWLYLAASAWVLIGIFQYVALFLGANNIDMLMRYPNDFQIGMVIEVVVVFMAIVYRYNLYKKEKEQLLVEVSEQQQNLIKRIVAAEEEERKRIAADLHDDVGATLSALRLHISNMPATLKDNYDIEKYFNRSLDLSNKAANDIRDIAHNLLPKDFKSETLFNIVEKKTGELNALGKIRFIFIGEGNEEKLTEMFSIIVYRIINELLTNILKHSLASEAVIQLLITEENVQIMAEDDGIGFNSEATFKGIGLKTLAGRIEFLKGNMQIDSSSRGTHTIINFTSLKWMKQVLIW